MTLSDEERVASLDLLASLDLSVPDQWNGRDDTALVSSIPGTGIELRYNIRPDTLDPESSYYYWSVLDTSRGCTLIVRGQYLEDVREHLEGEGYEGDPRPGQMFAVWSYRDTSRSEVLRLDDSTSLQIEVDDFTDASGELLAEVLKNWLYAGHSEQVWIFLLTRLLASGRTDGHEAGSESAP